MSNYWADHPPVHLMIAAYLGIEKSSKKPEEVNDFGDLFANGQQTEVSLFNE